MLGARESKEGDFIYSFHCAMPKRIVFIASSFDTSNFSFVSPSFVFSFDFVFFCCIFLSFATSFSSIFFTLSLCVEILCRGLFANAAYVFSLCVYSLALITCSPISLYIYNAFMNLKWETLWNFVFFSFIFYNRYDYFFLFARAPCKQAILIWLYVSLAKVCEKWYEPT